jgi:hypothetical protein
MGSSISDIALTPRSWTVMAGQDANDTWWWILLEGHTLIDCGAGFPDPASAEIAANDAIRVWERAASDTIPRVSM